MKNGPILVTDVNNRVMQLGDSHRQVLNGKLVQPTDFNAGWFVGGQDDNSGTTISTVDRILFSSDTSIATVRGPLQISVASSGGSENTTDGWMAGGVNNITAISNTQRIIFQNDIQIASVRGNLPLAKFASYGDGNNTDAWFPGGATTNSSTFTSNVSRITFQNDNTVASTRGNLSLQLADQGVHGNNTALWTFSGVTSVAFTTVITRITFASDTNVSTNRGNVTIARFTRSTGNLTDAWNIAGGTFLGETFTPFSRIDRITFANDTATASVRGNTISSASTSSMVENTTDAWFSVEKTTERRMEGFISRIIFANDTVLATRRGSRSVIIDGGTGVS